MAKTDFQRLLEAREFIRTHPDAPLKDRIPAAIVVANGGRIGRLEVRTRQIRQALGLGPEHADAINHAMRTAFGPERGRGDA